MPLCNSQEELIDWLRMFDGAGDVLLTSRTEVRMRKTNNPYIGAVKVQGVRVSINENYEQMVNNQREVEEKSADFKAEGLKWGECTDNVVVEHNGGLYIKTIELSRDPNAVYMLNDEVIDYELLRPFVPVYKPSPKQALAEDVKVRTFKIDSIVAVVVGDTVVYDAVNKE
jgi:hypothetical protein